MSAADINDKRACLRGAPSIICEDNIGAIVIELMDLKLLSIMPASLLLTLCSSSRILGWSRDSTDTSIKDRHLSYRVDYNLHRYITIGIVLLFICMWKYVFFSINIFCRTIIYIRRDDDRLLRISRRPILALGNN